MHETRLIRDLIDKIIESAAGEPVSQLTLALGPRCHLDAEGFADKYEVFSSGTVAEGAELIFTEPSPLDDPTGIRLLSITTLSMVPQREPTESAELGEGTDAEAPAEAGVGGRRTDHLDQKSPS